MTRMSKVLLCFLLLISQAFAQEDTRFEVFLRNASGSPVSGAVVYIVHMVTGDSLLVSPVAGKTGLYRRDDVEFGNYKVYVNGALSTTKKYHSTDREYNLIVNIDPDANNQIDTQGVENLAITEAKVASNAITTNKIASSAVTETKIAAGAVTNSKIGGNAVTFFKMALNSVGTGQIIDGSVTAIDLSNSSVDSDEITDSAIVKVDLSQSLIDFINTAGGGTINNFPNEKSITQNASNELLIKTAYFGSKFIDDYASVHAALDSIGSANSDLWITNQINLAQDDTIPANVRLFIPRGGTINPNGHNLLIQADMSQIGNHQIFTSYSDSSITIERNILNVMWWGAKNNDTDAANTTQAFNNAFAAFSQEKNPATLAIGSSKVVYVPPGEYAINDTVGSEESGIEFYGHGNLSQNLNRGSVLKFTNGGMVRFWWDGSQDNHVFPGPYVHDLGFEDVTDTLSNAGLEIKQKWNSIVERCVFRDFKGGKTAGADTATGILIRGEPNSTILGYIRDCNWVNCRYPIRGTGPTTYFDVVGGRMVWLSEYANWTDKHMAGIYLESGHAWSVRNVEFDALPGTITEDAWLIDVKTGTYFLVDGAKLDGVHGGGYRIGYNTTGTFEDFKVINQKGTPGDTAVFAADSAKRVYWGPSNRRSGNVPFVAIGPYKNSHQYWNSASNATRTGPEVGILTHKWDGIPAAQATSFQVGVDSRFDSTVYIKTNENTNDLLLLSKDDDNSALVFNYVGAGTTSGDTIQSFTRGNGSGKWPGSHKWHLRANQWEFYTGAASSSSSFYDTTGSARARPLSMNSRSFISFHGAPTVGGTDVNYVGMKESTNDPDMPADADPATVYFWASDTSGVGSTDFIAADGDGNEFNLTAGVPIYTIVQAGGDSIAFVIVNPISAAKDTSDWIGVH